MKQGTKFKKTRLLFCSLVCLVQTTVIAQPANDACANATTLACGTTNLAGTTVSAAQSPADPAGCASRRGVWYRFTGDGQQTTISSTASGWDHEMVIYSGACGSLTNIVCRDNNGSGGTETYTFTTVNGTNYLIYIAYMNTNGNASDTGPFTISRTCLAITVPPNDACADAVSLPCGTSNLSGTTNFAVQGPVDPAGCASRYGVWYRFTGDGQQTTISVTPTGWDPELVVYSGSCGSLTNIVCRDGGSSGAVESYTFVTVNGTTYYVYVGHYSTSGASTDTGPFTISRTCVPVIPPANDACADATSLPCGTSNLSGTTNFAVQGPVDPAGCASRYGVWYQFTGDGQQTTITVPATGWDHELIIYSGSCGVLTNVICKDDDGTGGTETYTFITVSGTSYYVYVTYYSTSGTSTNTGPFTISRSCMQAPDIAQPGGQVCDDAEPFCTDASILFPNITGVTSAQTGPNYGCVTSTYNPVWYYMEIQTSGNLQLTISQEDVNGTGIDVDFTMWGPFTSPTAACNSIEAGTAPIQSGYSASATETVGLGVQGGSYLSNTGCIGVTTPPAAAAGNTYVVMITNYDGDPGYISFSQTGGSAATNCNIVVLGDILQFTGENKNEENKLYWEVDHEMNVSHYVLNRSTNGTDWTTVKTIPSEGVFESDKKYEVTDKNYRYVQNYYQVISVDYDGNEEKSQIIYINNAEDGSGKTLLKIVNNMGQTVNESYKGLKIYIYSDGTTLKKMSY
ncbi:hypothetical protein G5B10_02940 [Fluviicola sp. SGL-29]|nr:hypothetical protein [Fluviicola sp. SGL-29]